MIKNCLVISLTSLTLLMACVDNTAIKTSATPSTSASIGKGITITPIPSVATQSLPLRADSPTLEQDLNQAMAQSDKVEVKLSTPVEPEKEGLQPITLAEVMDAVVKSGGKVNYEPIKAEMAIGALVFLVPLVVGMITEWLTGDATVATPSVPEPQNRFPQASRFDVRMCFLEQNNKVTKVVLVPRGDDKKGACANS